MDGDERSASLLPSARGPRRLALTGVIVSGLGMAASDRRADAYLLYDNGAFDYIVGSDQALRWSADVWGPGETLVWEIEDGEDWSLLFDSAQDVAPLIEEALAIWSGIETADISWRLASVPTAAEEGRRYGDSRHRVFVERYQWNDQTWFVGGAHLWWVRNHTENIWELTDCDVGLPWHWWLDEDLEPRTDWDPELIRRNIIRYAAQEFGHCLGLGDAVPFPGSRALRRTPGGDDVTWRHNLWGRSPLMDNFWEQLSQDDRAAASLLRPRPGWRSTVGSVSGTVALEGVPVPYVHVYAIQSTAAGMREPVGAFTNNRGEFLIEGLPPGDYILWALPVRIHWNHHPLIFAGAATNLKDAVLANPIRVQAGVVTGGTTIPMRRGRP